MHICIAKRPVGNQNRIVMLVMTKPPSPLRRRRRPPPPFDVLMHAVRARYAPRSRVFVSSDHRCADVSYPALETRRPPPSRGEGMVPAQPLSQTPPLTLRGGGDAPWELDWERRE